MPRCVHCKRMVSEARACKGRGLCAMCHQNKAIRRLYPKRNRDCGSYDQHPDCKLTLEQLEQVIEERRANAPPWFWRENQQHPKQLPWVLRNVVRSKPR